MFTDQLRVQKYGKKWRLTQPLIYKTETKFVVVPMGFISDKTTWYVEGAWTEAAVLHDYLLFTEVDRDIADAHMREAMRSLNVDWFNYCVISCGILMGNLWSKRK